MLSIWLALLLFATAPEAVEPPPRGRLCVGEEKCIDTTTATIAVKPTDRERRFFWLSDDAKTAYAGVIAPKAQLVVLDPEKFSALDMAIDGDASRGWPLDVAMTLGTTQQPEWKWKLDGDTAKRLRRLYVPQGSYSLTATVAHHRQHRTRVVAGAKPSKVNIQFVPLAVARGVVVDWEDKPIAEAEISLPDATLCATADEQGAFTCELPERAYLLVVSRSGYASREIEIIRPSLDLGRIRLSAGRTLTLNISQPEPAPARVSLVLDGHHLERTKLKTISISKREETVRFDAAAGRYVVRVEGDGPLERLEVPLTMKDEDLEQDIRVAPFQLLGSVRFGDDPLQDGTIEFLVRGEADGVTLPVSGGVFTATMWQDGVSRAWVKGPQLPQPDVFESPKLGDDPSRWDIHIEKRMIAGRLFDATTRALVTDANFEVNTDDGSSSYFPVQPDGSYQILAHKPGTYTLQVTTDHYAPYKAELRITAEDRTRTHDIFLESGVMQPIDVLTPGGAGLARAAVFDGAKIDPEIYGASVVTDERGRYELRGVAGQVRLLYFIPLAGSFAVTRVQLPRTNADVKPLQVVVPAPSCALRVRTVNEDGQQIPAGLLIRYNGEFIPPAILRVVTRGAATDRTGEAVLSRLPAGAYEIWAITDEHDADRLMASAGSLRKPAKVGLSAGEQEVTVVVPRGHASRGRE